MPCQVVNSQTQVQSRLPSLPASMPTTQGEWINFTAILQQWGQALQQDNSAPNVLPPTLQTFSAASGPLALSALTATNCTIAIDNSHQFYGAASLGVSGLTNPATIAVNGFPIPIQGGKRWFAAFQVLAPAGCAGSLQLSTNGSHSVSEAFSVPASASWQQVWGLFDLTKFADTQATLQFTFTSTAAVNLDGLQMNSVGKNFGILPKFAGAQMALGTTQWLAGTPGAFVSETGLAKHGDVDSTWDTAAYTLLGHTVFHLVAKPNALTDNCMIGVSMTPTASVFFSNNQWSWQNNAGTWALIEDSTTIGTFGSVALTDVVAITSDGTTLSFWINGAVAHTTTAGSSTWYGYAAFFKIGSAWNSVQFGPGAVLPLIHNAQIGQNAVDPSSGQLAAKGSVAATSIISSVDFSWTTTSGQVVISWPSFVLYRPDGSTTTVSAGGGTTVTGLTNSTVYTVYPYVAEGATTASFATGLTGSAGSPAICYAGGSPQAAQAMYLNGNVPLNSFTVTPSAGGGGGGGDHTGCLHPATLVETWDGRVVRARDVRHETLIGPKGPVRVTHILRQLRSEWVRVRLNNGEMCTVTMDHRFVRPDDSLVAARDMRIGEFLKGREAYVQVRSLALISEPVDMVAINVEEPHTYFLAGALSHNGTPKP